MRSATDIIKRPYITEKSNIQMGEGKYTFIVDTTATKTEIKLAVEKLFKVKVLNVNTANYFGKQKRVGVHVGNCPDWKKAIVKIAVDSQSEDYLIKGGARVSTGKKYKTSIEEFGAV